MIVCVDIGNTSTKAAAVLDGAIVARESLPTRGLDGAALIRLIASVTSAVRAGVEVVAVSSVVPGAPVAAVGVAGARRVVVTGTTDLPIRLAVSEPETVGADRLCAACGAVDETRRDAVIVDVGTAITVDRVRDLEFIGGAIMPGPRTMLRSLHRDTGGLPELDLDALETLFPARAHPTANAIALGAGSACAGGILEAVRRLAGGEPGVGVFVTGGDARFLRPALPEAWRDDPDLTLRGLARIATHVTGA